MSCKEQWEKEMAGRLQARSRVAAGQVDGGQRCTHEGCTALVNRATNRCVKGHSQDPTQARDEYVASLAAAVRCMLREQVAAGATELQDDLVRAVLEEPAAPGYWDNLRTIGRATAAWNQQGYKGEIKQEADPRVQAARQFWSKEQIGRDALLKALEEAEQPGEIAEYAARGAVNELLSNWVDALADGYTLAELLPDVGRTVTLLRRWEQALRQRYGVPEARPAGRTASPGLGETMELPSSGRTVAPEQRVQRLLERSLEALRAPTHEANSANCPTWEECRACTGDDLRKRVAQEVKAELAVRAAGPQLEPEATGEPAASPAVDSGEPAAHALAVAIEEAVGPGSSERTTHWLEEVGEVREVGGRFYPAVCPDCGGTQWGEPDAGDSTVDCLDCGMWFEPASVRPEDFKAVAEHATALLADVDACAEKAFLLPLQQGLDQSVRRKLQAALEEARSTGTLPDTLRQGLQRALRFVWGYQSGPVPERQRQLQLLLDSWPKET